MSDYDNTNSGALFKNDKKETDNHPDYRGSLNVDGREFWVSSWIKTSKKGQKYMSLSVSAKDENKTSRQEYSDKNQEPAPDFDDGIPFAFILPTLLGLTLAGSQVMPVFGGA